MEMGTRPVYLLFLVLTGIFWLSSAALSFVEAPDDRVAVLGQDLHLHCTVVDTNTGTSDGLTIKWRQNGAFLNPKSLTYPNGTLFIPNTEASDLGRYTCLVYNDSNSVLVLTSEPALVFTTAFKEEPEAQAVVFGQDLFLNCSAEDLPQGTSERLTVHWNQNSYSINPKASIYANGTLLVPGVQQGDLGNYTCFIVDSGSVVVLRSRAARVFHAYIKMFEVSPTPVYALEDSVISFDCITGESAPHPLIYWERDGVPFHGGDQHKATYGGYSQDSLAIQYSMKLMMRAKPYLDGAYNCVARNPVLQIDVRSLKVRLQTVEMETAPYVMQEQLVTDVITPLGQSMMLDCPIAGKPKVTITWYMRDLLIDGLAGFYTLQNGSLQRTTTSLEDESWYYCAGTNSLGSVRTPNITVTLSRIEIEFQREPEDLYMIAGLPATLRCAPPHSVPAATVTWYKDDALLVTRTGDQSVQVVSTRDGFWNVEFREIQERDEGSYFCVAYNEYAVPTSRTSRVVTVRVGGAPIFVEPPVGVTIEKGKLVQLTCYVQGDPFPEVTWLFEDRVLEASSTVSFRQGNQELWVGNVHKGNEGTYTCRAVNRYGAIQTRVYVKVLVPPVILAPVGDIVVSRGENVVVPCGVYSDPVATVTWYKDSAALILGGRFTQIPDGLYITSVQVEDGGTYLCEATNMAGRVENQGTLEVLVLPTFVESPQSQTVNMGTNVTLTCVASGSPKPQVTWLFNGSSLFPKDTLLSLTQERLLLMRVSWLHVGEYTCIAGNNEGSTRATATIKVRVPPTVEQITGIPLLYQGEHLQLQCHVTGIPAPQLEWFFNWEPVVESNNGRVTLPEHGQLSVKYVTSDDAGIYSCKGSNAAGVSQREIQVYIIGRPSPPGLYQAQTVTATSVRLSWSIEQRVPQTPVDNVLIQYRPKLHVTSPYTEIKLDSTVLQYEVMDLDPATEYVFMVSAVNGAGTSDISNVLSARTFDAGPSSPRNLQVEEVGAVNVTVSWEIPLTTNGVIRKYQLKYGQRNAMQDTQVEIPSQNNASHRYMITGLTPYVWYSVQVRGATMEGDQVLWGNWSQTINVKTQQAAPSGTAQELRAQPLTSTSIQVSWEAVSQDMQNGPIKRYYVQYWLLGNTSWLLGEEVVDSLDLQVNITDLDPWTYYVVKVIPENAGGRGEPSAPITVRTFPTAPSSPPLAVQARGHSARSILVQWQPPPVEARHSDLTGFVVQYWGGETSGTLHSFGLLDLAAIISELVPYTDYELRVAAFTDQVTDGTGPYSENITATTLMEEPGEVEDLRFTARLTSLKISWKKPAVTNGVISHYLVKHFLIGPATVTTPPPKIQPIMAEYVDELTRDVPAMREMFENLNLEVTNEILEPIAVLCDELFQNESVFEEFENQTDFSQSEYLLQFNISYRVTDWMFGFQQPIGRICTELMMLVVNIIADATVEEDVAVYNVSVTTTSVTLTNLDPDHLYNVTVTAATEAGYGPPSYLQASTLKQTPTPIPTALPPRPPTRPPATVVEPVTEALQGEPLNLPVIIGGGVSGFVLLVIVLIVVCCVCARRKKAQSEEKARVLQQESIDDGQMHNSMFGELDVPRAPAIASAAEDGTDSVDMFADEVRFQTPSHRGNRSNMGTVRSFMTEASGQSGQVPVSNGRRIKEAFLGMPDNPSYTGLSAPGTIKNNPAYYDEEPYSSDQESMSVTMALSSEDTLWRSQSQVSESPLQRKTKMRGSEAAAIAHLRSNKMPPAMLSDNDRSALINRDVEVVYNERTAL